MKITKVHFEKLFGYFNYTIDFHEAVTIIHGPNGCGKTTMLQIIDAIFNKKLAVVKSKDFKYVQFTLSTGATLKVERKRVNLDPKNENAGEIVYLAYELKYKGAKPMVFDSFENSEDYRSVINRFLHGYRPFPYLERLSEDTWLDKRHDKKISLEEVITQYGPAIYRRYGRDLIEDDIPQEIQDVINQIEVRLITADRLTVQKRVERQYGEESIKVERRVSIIAGNVAQKIRDAIQKYAQLSQAKDRTFPLRAIQQNSPMTVEQIKEKMVQLEEKRAEFIDTGILEEEKDGIDIHELVEAITENNRQNLSLYAIDTEEKLNALSDISASINLFRTLIDNSFKNKKIIFSKEDGFHFVTTYNNSKILPKNLSSGEQHELVMFFDLIFNSSENTLVLIDEPELSLHIKWQLSYVDELLNIIKRTKFCAVLATHSPQIIHDKWELTVSLSE